MDDMIWVRMPAKQKAALSAWNTLSVVHPALALHTERTFRFVAWTDGTLDRANRRAGYAVHEGLFPSAAEADPGSSLRRAGEDADYTYGGSLAPDTAIIDAELHAIVAFATDAGWVRAVPFVVHCCALGEVTADGATVWER